MAMDMPSLLKSVLPKIEIASILITAAGFALRYLAMPAGNTALMLGLTALSGVFFLTAFVLPPDYSASDGTVPTGQGEQVKQKNFLTLFITVIWKIIHISLAVSSIGLLFYILQLEGYGQMLMIGTAASGASLFVSVIFVLMSNNNLQLLKGVLIKILFLFLLSLYVVYSNWPLPLAPQS